MLRGKVVKNSIFYIKTSLVGNNSKTEISIHKAFVSNDLGAELGLINWKKVSAIFSYETGSI